MHVGNGRFRARRLVISKVGSPSIGLKLFVQRKIDCLDTSISAKDLPQVSFCHILGELFHHNLGALYPVSALISTVAAIAVLSPVSPARASTSRDASAVVPPTAEAVARISRRY